MRIAGHPLSLDPDRQRLYAPSPGSMTGMRELRFPVDGTVFPMGSACPVGYAGPNTQSVHAEGKWEDGHLLVRDKEGDDFTTLVNGAPVGPSWTPMKDGQHLTLGELADPNLVLAVGPAADAPAPVASGRSVLMTYYGDGTSPDIASDVRQQASRMDRAIQRSHAPIQVRGVLANGSRLGDLAMAASPYALGLLGVAGGAGAVLALASRQGALAAVSGMLGAIGALGCWGVQRNDSTYWREMQQKREDAADRWSHVERQVVAHGPRASELKALLETNQRQFPQARHVVYLSGHGDQQGAAGMSYADLGQSIQGAEAILIDACLAGQLESLSQLTDSARVAVCSEHTVAGMGFPLESMVSGETLPEGPQALGAALVERGARGRPAKSLVAVDLAALRGQLLPSLDLLGRALQRMGRHRDAVAAAFEKCERPEPTVSKSCLDLGNFLALLDEDESLRRDCPQLERARTAFNHTILAMAGHGSISFDRYPSSDLPEGWRAFLKAFR